MLDIIALIFFVLCWHGFPVFVRRRAASGHLCLSTTLEYYRDTWMSEMVNDRDRVADVQMLAMFERSCTFFASSSLIIVAGLLTFLGSIDKVTLIAQKFGGIYIDYITYKTIALLILFIYSFFAFTWSIRQFGFVGFMVVGAPLPKKRGYTAAQRNKFAQNTSTVIDLAAHSSQNGLRTYYYSLALLSWFAGPLFLIGSSVLVTMVMYRREFHSKTMSMLKKAHQDLTETMLIDEGTNATQGDEEE